MISAAQIRAGRAIVRMTQAQLAAISGISAVAIKKIEAEQVKPREATLEKIKAALVLKGVAFWEDTGGQWVSKRFDQPVFKTNIPDGSIAAIAQRYG